MWALISIKDEERVVVATSNVELVIEEWKMLCEKEWKEYEYEIWEYSVI